MTRADRENRAPKRTPPAAPLHLLCACGAEVATITREPYAARTGTVKQERMTFTCPVCGAKVQYPPRRKKRMTLEDMKKAKGLT